MGRQGVDELDGFLGLTARADGDLPGHLFSLSKDEISQ